MKMKSTSSPIGGDRNSVGIVALLVLPILMINLVAFVVPVLGLLKNSFYSLSPTGAIIDVVTLDTWISILTDGFYLRVILRTIIVGLAITLITLVVSYPIAFYIHRSTGTLKSLLIVMVISPLLISAVVRTYGWVAILSEQGLINSMLGSLGFGPYRLIYNMAGVMIGLVEILMPYMIISLLAGFGKLDGRLEEAAATLGAAPFRVFRTVILPLTAPGMALGSMLTFVISVSAFITPQLLGGGRVFLLASEIYQEAIVSLDWPVAAVLSAIVLVVFGAALAVYSRLARSVF